MTIQPQTGSDSSGQASVKRPTTLLVKVIDSRDGRLLTNVSLPLGIVRWGMKIAPLFAPEVRNANVDWDAIGALIQDGAAGQLVHVEDEKKHQTVEVWVQ